MIVQVDLQDELADAAVADLEELVTGKMRDALTYIQAETVARGPKLSGWFRGSVTPYCGEISSFKPERGLPFYPEQGDDAVDQAFSQFLFGDEVGVVSNADHANRLAHGWSTQAADGWTDVIAIEASNL